MTLTDLSASRRTQCFVSVSYTHLDVYKRQAQARCGEMLSEASLAWGFGVADADPLSGIASVTMPNLVLFLAIRGSRRPLAEQ